MGEKSVFAITVPKGEETIKRFQNAQPYRCQVALIFPGSDFRCYCLWQHLRQEFVSLFDEVIQLLHNSFQFTTFGLGLVKSYFLKYNKYTLTLSYIMNTRSFLPSFSLAP